MAAVLLSACAATDDQVLRVEPPIEHKGRPVASGAPAAPASGEEPIYSTSTAITLAELSLKAAGAEPRDRSVQVSFCDGLYTVTFERPESEAGACDFVVVIDGKTSRVVKVVTRP
ncbi:MAG: hypothetical protein GYA21_09360 [Myxococcales bacterium]|nr:hypothetical protein [Myxococcales bacterium]